MICNHQIPSGLTKYYIPVSYDPTGVMINEKNIPLPPFSTKSGHATREEHLLLNFSGKDGQ